MNNTEVKAALDSTEAELVTVETLIITLGATASITPFLTRYSIVKASGSLEVAFKTIIADHCCWRAKPQLKNYINNNIRESSNNPSYANICSLLNELDNGWNDEFKKNIKSLPESKKITDSLQSLVDARNEFAHGGTPSVSIASVRDYFRNARSVIEVLDTIVC